jgi:hypothetical protein
VTRSGDGGEPADLAFPHEAVNAGPGSDLRGPKFAGGVEVAVGAASLADVARSRVEGKRDAVLWVVPPAIGEVAQVGVLGEPAIVRRAGVVKDGEAGGADAGTLKSSEGMGVARVDMGANAHRGLAIGIEIEAEFTIELEVMAVAEWVDTRPLRANFVIEEDDLAVGREEGAVEDGAVAGIEKFVGIEVNEPIDTLAEAEGERAVSVLVLTDHHAAVGTAREGLRPRSDADARVAGQVRAGQFNGIVKPKVDAISQAEVVEAPVAKGVVEVASCGGNGDDTDHGMASLLRMGRATAAAGPSGKEYGVCGWHQACAPCPARRIFIGTLDNNIRMWFANQHLFPVAFWRG